MSILYHMPPIAMHPMFAGQYQCIVFPNIVEKGKYLDSWWDGNLFDPLDFDDAPKWLAEWQETVREVEKLADPHLSNEET